MQVLVNKGFFYACGFKLALNSKGLRRAKSRRACRYTGFKFALNSKGLRSGKHGQLRRRDGRRNCREIYIYDPAAPDDVFDDFKSAFLALPDEVIKQHSGLRADGIRRVREALNSPHICQLNQLALAPGIGDRTLEKSFAFVSRYRQSLACAPEDGKGDASAAVQQGFGF